MNGQEKDDEITGSTGSHYSAQYWEYDSRIGRRWNLDPKPVPSISSYACFANNPLSYSDIFGDSIGLGKSLLKNKEQMEAFTLFANTKEGKEFLSQYAKAGQTIAGVTFEKSGEYDLKNIDLMYEAKTADAFGGGERSGGETGTEYKYDAKQNVNGATISVTLFNGKGWESSSELFNKVSTVFHESFIHVDLTTKDFLDNHKFDNTNITPDQKVSAGMLSAHFQHIKVRQDFIKYGYKSQNLFPTKAYYGLMRVANSKNIKISNYEVQSAMWNYNGGLKIDNKSGDLKGSY